MSKEINLEEILTEVSIKHEEENYSNEIVFEAIKEAVRQALELAVENVELKEFLTTPQDQNTISNDMGDIYGVDKQSILDTIKQIK